MTNYDIQYISDTILIERYANIDAIINKRGGLISDSLGLLAQAVKEFVIDRIDTSSVDSLIKSVIDLLAPAVFFRIHPVLGILTTAGQLMGFSVGDLLGKIVGYVKSELQSKGSVNPSGLNQLGQQLISYDNSSADDYKNDLLHDLRALDKAGKLVKIARGLGIFSSLGRYRSRNLVVGFLIWFVKTILLSAGLLTGMGTAGKILGLTPSKPGNEPTDIEQGSYQIPETMETTPSRPNVVIPVKKNNLKSSGRGEEYHPNDSNSAWVVPIYGNLKKTLVGWAVDIYPELRGYENDIYASPSFNRTANILGSYMNYRSPNYLMMPPGFNRRIDVVDTFAGDVEQQIKSKEVV